jgi:hypothetical protein
MGFSAVITLHQWKLHTFYYKIGQMAEEAKAQNTTEKLHLQTIAELRAIVENEQQAKKVSAK